jgi:hypothetical protein
MNVRVLPNISCPTCQSSQVIKAEYEGIVEQTILRLFEMFPLLCQACDMRFYMFLARPSNQYAERVQ